LAKPIHILLVEDDPTHARIANRALTTSLAEVRVLHVGDGDEAINVVLGRGTYEDRSKFPRPDLVLLDLRLPNVSGFQVLEVMGSDQTARLIPVVVLTTSDRPEDINRSYAAGANAFVTKPVSYDQFIRKIQDIARFWAFTSELPAI
jgi:CheY-like chemotaxis protein